MIALHIYFNLAEDCSGVSPGMSHACGIVRRSARAQAQDTGP